MGNYGDVNVPIGFLLQADGIIGTMESKGPLYSRSQFERCSTSLLCGFIKPQEGSSHCHSNHS